MAFVLLFAFVAFPVLIFATGESGSVRLCISDARAYLIEDLTTPLLRSIHRRFEARFGKRVAEAFFPSLFIAALFGLMTVTVGWHTLLSALLFSLALAGIVVLAALALTIAGTVVGLSLLCLGKLFDHVRRWLRWLTTAYLREG